MAERAFRFERDEETATFLQGSYWDAGHAGLLAGAKLQNDLLSMERRFIETNYRKLEIDQSFSLSQIDPQALIRLKETGECDFTLAEIFFDLAYPGHYRRRIRAVRLTIPSVTGPFVNVGATLSLTRSQIRMAPALGDDQLVEVPVSRPSSIATSNAQDDPGVFDLSFRDERHMPFEGAGAESTWQLDLPKDYPAFDYATISDVILHIRYTARQGVDPTKVKTALDALFQQATPSNLALLFSLLELLARPRRRDAPDAPRAVLVGQARDDPAAVVAQRPAVGDQPLLAAERAGRDLLDPGRVAWRDVLVVQSRRQGVQGARDARFVGHGEALPGPYELHPVPSASRPTLAEQRIPLPRRSCNVVRQVERRPTRGALGADQGPGRVIRPRPQGSAVRARPRTLGRAARRPAPVGSRERARVCAGHRRGRRRLGPGRRDAGEAEAPGDEAGEGTADAGLARAEASSRCLLTQPSRCAQSTGGGESPHGVELDDA